MLFNKPLLFTLQHTRHTISLFFTALDINLKAWNSNMDTVSICILGWEQSITGNVCLGKAAFKEIDACRGEVMQIVCLTCSS